MAISSGKFFGRAAEQSSATTVSINPVYARCWSIEMTAASQQVRMPVPEGAGIREGYPIAYVYNKGATHAFTLAKADGTTIVSVPVGNVAAVALIDSAGQGTWITDVGAV